MVLRPNLTTNTAPAQFILRSADQSVQLVSMVTGAAISGQSRSAGLTGGREREGP